MGLWGNTHQRIHGIISDMNCCTYYWAHSLSCFCPQDKNQRSLDMDTAKLMLALLLGRSWPLFPVFSQFLEVNLIALIKEMWNQLIFKQLFTPLSGLFPHCLPPINVSHSSPSTRDWIKTSGIMFWSSAGPSTQTSVTTMRMELVSTTCTRKIVQASFTELLQGGNINLYERSKHGIGCVGQLSPHLDHPGLWFGNGRCRTVCHNTQEHIWIGSHS